MVVYCVCITAVRVQVSVSPILLYNKQKRIYFNMYNSKCVGMVDKLLLGRSGVIAVRVQVSSLVHIGLLMFNK